MRLSWSVSRMLRSQDSTDRTPRHSPNGSGSISAIPGKRKKAGIEGKVLISFKITAEGKLTDVKLRKGVHPLLDKEAVRVVKSAPQKWEPGEKTKGVPVDVTYTMPVVFTLPDKE
ncbi:MAG: energy transducer TonB [Bacteroidales bacterium]|nr:energy transducer TonB [Bacteroidales bacterium]